MANHNSLRIKCNSLQNFNVLHDFLLLDFKKNVIRKLTINNKPFCKSARIEQQRPTIKLHEIEIKSQWLR